MQWTSILLTVICICSLLIRVTITEQVQIQLKVGLYNSIPDINDDDLESYKVMVENGYNAVSENTINAVVNESEYSPYDGKLVDHLESGDFDLVEIDTASLTDDIKELIMPVHKIGVPLQDDVLPSARLAVQDGPTLYGYPTLVCGNFIIGLSPSTECSCLFKPSKYSHGKPDGNYENPMKECKDQLDMTQFVTYERLVAGKMNDDDGWYLPFIFLDAYIDEYGPSSITEGIDLVLDDDSKVGDIVNRLCYPLFDLCRYEDGQGCEEQYKCLHGDYTTDSAKVLEDIENKKSMFFFGFSERIADVVKETRGLVCPYAATSFSNGASNYMLQFTDALVVSKVAWENANDKRKYAIRQFISYFTGLELRRKIALGEDLPTATNRYLLQALESFYKSVDDDHVYRDIYWHLLRSVPAPALNGTEMGLMQENLEKYLPNSKPRAYCGKKKRKTEL